jgi:hypothetical protein
MGNLKKLQVDGVDILPLVSEYETYDSEGNSISDKYANKNTVSSQMTEVSNKITNANNQLTTVSNYVTGVVNKYGDTNDLSTNSKDSIVSALNDIYSARNNAKQQIVNALSEKGITASTSESIESLINKINTIEAGNDIPEWYVPTNASNFWTQAAKMTGTEDLTSGDAIICSTYTSVGDDIYFIGGAYVDFEEQGSASNPLSNVYCYNSINNSWSSKKGFAASYYGTGTGVAYHASTYHNGYIYVCGGYFGSTTEISNIHYRYNIANNSWSSRNALPYVLSCHSYHTIGNTLYAIGGYYNTAYYHNPDVYSYSPSSNAWTTKTASNYDNIGGYHEGAAVLNNTIYDLNIEKGAFSQYDPTTNAWTQKVNVAIESTFPPIVSALNGNIHAFTRIYIDGEADVNYHHCYNPTTDTWTSKANLPAGVYAFDTRAAVANGHMYVVTNAGNNYCYIP